MLQTSLVVAALASIPSVFAYPTLADALNCRSGPGTNYEVVKSYTSGADITISCQVSGTDVYGLDVWDKTQDGCYVSDYYVDTNGADSVAATCSADGGSRDSTTYPVKVDSLNCRSGPGTGYDVVKSYTGGQELSITCQVSGTDVNGWDVWDKTQDGCYVSDYYVDTDGADSVAPDCGGDSGTTDPPPSDGSGGDIISAAQSQEGLPYVWGGGGCDGPSGGGFDCSGLTQYSICQTLNVEIPRTAQTQYDATDMGQRLPREDAQPGDLLFWADGGDCEGSVSHVAIYISDGWMVNAARTGTPVREQAIWEEYGGIYICPEVMRFW
ncbi:uncharacterized protein BJX67DRAFT_368303 [Aspergillus lucknowensis]|uniref:NlpC/P60 domain-containing protein n=1 Tax=Aspergillus lucknowensis TaxID=176173 RepID=A0ABR4L673_9EURO